MNRRKQEREQALKVIQENEQAKYKLQIEKERERAPCGNLY